MSRVYMISRLIVGGAWCAPGYLPTRVDETVAELSWSRVTHVWCELSALPACQVDSLETRTSIDTRFENRFFFWRFLRLCLLEETSRSKRRVGTGCRFGPTPVA